MEAGMGQVPDSENPTQIGGVRLCTFRHGKFTEYQASRKSSFRELKVRLLFLAFPRTPLYGRFEISPLSLLGPRKTRFLTEDSEGKV